MDILPFLDEVQSIARNGLAYTTNPYDRERYDRLLTLVSDNYGRILDEPGQLIKKRFLNELGYITPKVGAEAALFDDTGKILLVQRNNDGQWCLPCGWIEPSESPAEAAIREAREETGLEITVVELVDIFSRKPDAGFGPHSAIAIVYLCEKIGGELLGSHEGWNVRYWEIDEVPGWHELHEMYARSAKQAWLKCSEK